VGDEIRHCNEIRVYPTGREWFAVIGPNMELGMYALGSTPEEAAQNLTLKTSQGWPWDLTWIDRLDALAARRVPQ
jgi:hypothetical protein